MKKVFLALVVLLVLHFTAVAQCSMCTKTASELDGKSAQGLNSGIVYLAFIPLGILGTIGYLWWRNNRNDI